MFTVENLAVRLGDKNILQNVHFTIDTPGQLVGILGANGSGKTTLLRAVAGLLPHTGCCLMDGVPLESLSTRCLAQTVSYIPQQSGISVSMSAREVVLMGCNPRLGVLQSLALGYLTLGEATPSLSGGEAQRLKLASEMGRGQEDSVFVFDEPTIGLHPLDVQTLVRVFQTLIDNGATVIVIEHDLDVMRSADYIIDMGPGGGEAGGRVVAAGTPEEIAQNGQSITGRYLAK